MRAPWTFLLGGLIVWAAHFLLLYVLGEFVGRTPVTQAAIVAATVAAIVATGLVARAGTRLRIDGGFDRWRRSTTLLGSALAALAIAWQSLPALL